MRWCAITALVIVAATFTSATTAAPAAPASTSAGCSPRWRLVAETAGPWLNGSVAALAADDVWAAGRIGPKNDTAPALVHWDGRRLRRYTAFTPTREGGGSVGGLSAVSSSDIWALGRDGDPSARSNRTVNTAVVVHWDGREWTRMPTPPVPKGAYIHDIAAAGPADVWLVGEGGPYYRPIILHWNGTRWGVADLWKVTPWASALTAIAARSPNDVWAVGIAGLDAPVSFGFTDLVMHWDGRHWRQVDSRVGDYGAGPYALAVGIAPSGQVWTVNQDQSGNDPVFARLSADGHQTSILAPSLAFDPNQIVPVSDTSVWVRGVDYSKNGFDGTSALFHWNGTTWRPSHIPHADMKHEPFWGLSALAPTDVWAAGGRLLARWSC